MSGTKRPKSKAEPASEDAGDDASVDDVNFEYLQGEFQREFREARGEDLPAMTEMYRVVRSLDEAYYRRNYADLLCVLRAGLVLTPSGTRLVGEALAALLSPRPGATPRMTPWDRKLAFHIYHWLLNQGHNKTAAIAHLANDFGVEEQTIKRALRRAPVEIAELLRRKARQNPRGI